MLNAARLLLIELFRQGLDTVEISNSAIGIGGGWNTFQSRLRQRRQEAAAGCTTCTVGAVSERDSADTLRKAV